MLETNKTSEVIWPTQTLTVEIRNAGELNRSLVRVILEKERELKAKKSTPVAGLSEGLTTHWLEYNVLRWNHPAIDQFREIVLAGLRDYLAMLGDPADPGLQVSGISCWANVLRQGESLAVHHHDPAFVSAHYQVQSEYSVVGGGDARPAAAAGEGGNTVYFRPGFLDRSHGGKAGGPTSPWDEDWRISVPPLSGKLFFFPSYVRHEVRPNMGPVDRVSIAMDVFVKRQELPIYFGGPRWLVP